MEPADQAPDARPRAAFALLVVAGVAHLPVVHALVARDEQAPPLVLGMGLLSMGLAWSAGCALQRRRRRTVLGIGALAVLEPALLLAPAMREPLAPHLGLLALASACALAGLALSWRR